VEVVMNGVLQQQQEEAGEEAAGAGFIRCFC
jgi:hypothetical protein